MTPDQKRSPRKILAGIVISEKMDKTVVVDVPRIVQHPMFKKYIRRRSRLYVHDQENEAHVGDRVEIMETKPFSKTKSFRLVRIVERARIPSSTPRVTFDEPGGGED